MMSCKSFKDSLTDSDKTDSSLDDKNIHVFHSCPNMKEIISTKKFTSSTPIYITGAIVDFSLKGIVQSNEEEKILYFYLEYSPDFKLSDYELKWSVSIYNTETDDYHFVGNSVYNMKNSQQSDRLCALFEPVNLFLQNNPMTIAWLIDFLPFSVSESTVDLPNITSGGNILHKVDEGRTTSQFTADLSNQASHIINSARYKTSLENIAKTIDECQKQAMVNKSGIEAIKYDVTEMEKRLSKIFHENTYEQMPCTMKNQCEYSEISSTACGDKPSVPGIPLDVILRSKSLNTQVGDDITVESRQNKMIKVNDDFPHSDKYGNRYSISDPQLEIDLLLISKTGIGKNALGYSTRRQTDSVNRSPTTEAAMKITEEVNAYEDKVIKVVEISGVGDPYLHEEKTKTFLESHLSNAMSINPRGFNAFLIDLKVGETFTREDRITIEVLKKTFGENVISKFCILFITPGDPINQDITFEEWIAKENSDIYDLIKECSNRVVLFDNKTEDNEKKECQMKRLLDIVHDLIFYNSRIIKEQFFSEFERPEDLILEYEKQPRNAKEYDHLTAIPSQTDPNIENKTDLNLEDKNDLNSDTEVKLQTGGVIGALQASTMKLSLKTKGSFTESKDINILLIGKTGNGKSATGNIILNRYVFECSDSLELVTSDVQYGYTEFKGRKIKVVDGPGVEDTGNMKDLEKSTEVMIEKMPDAVLKHPDGYHAFLLVVRYGGRFTSEDKKVVEMMKSIFGQHILKDCCIILMTNGDVYRSHKLNRNKKFEKWCSEQKGVLKELLEECGNRAILFDNKTDDPEVREKQMTKLIKVIDKLHYIGPCYCDAHFKLAEKNRKSLLVDVTEHRITENIRKECYLILQKATSISPYVPEEH